MIVATLILCVLIQPLYAQDQPQITATVDRNSLSTDDILTLTVVVNAVESNLPNPTVPPLDGFAMAGNSSSSQISIVNGAVNAQTTYSYRLQPYITGTLTIEPIQLVINGQSFSTAPITIDVTAGTGTTASASQGQAQPTTPNVIGQDLFIESVVDKQSPFLGEQILHSFRFYEAVDSRRRSNIFGGQPSYNAPTFTDFWNERQSDQSQYRVQVGERIYNVVELRTNLFPTQAGSLTIESATLTISGGGFQQDTVLQAEPINLDVRPLPDNPPAGFEGVVGQYRLQATVEPVEGVVNEPLTLRLTLSGQGNVQALTDPIWPELTNWRTFDSQATTNTQLNEEGMLVGSRLYERVLIPAKAGDFTIPAIEYTYFDTAEASYRTLSTEPIAVSISPGSTTTISPLPLPAAEEAPPVIPTITDIRHIKALPTALGRATPLLIERIDYWLVGLVPFVGFLSLLIWQQSQGYRQGRGRNRRSHAYKEAQTTLRRVKIGEPELYNKVQQILNTYLSQKLAQPVVGLTQNALANLLNQKELPQALVNNVKDCLSMGDAARFGPVVDSPNHEQDFLQQAEETLSQLEKELSKT